MGSYIIYAIYQWFKVCDIRNRRKEDEKFEIWKYGCTNANEPDWDADTTTTGWSTTSSTTTLDPKPNDEDDNFTDDEILHPGSEWYSGGNEDDFYPFGEDEESYASVDTWDTSSDGNAVTDDELIANGIHPHDYTHNKHCWVRESFDYERKFRIDE